MKSLAISVFCALFACSCASQQSARKAGTDRSMSLGNGDIAASQTSAPTAPKARGPQVIQFEDAKFSVVIPNADWKVEVTPQGVKLLNAKAGGGIRGLVTLHLREDSRPLKDIAEAERSNAKTLGNLVVSDVKMASDPERATFVVIAPMADGSKLMMLVVFLRNPGNPKQTIGIFGLWMEGQDDARAEVLGILGSIRPLQ